MKRIFTFASMVAWVLLMPGITSAQLTNGGFENWTNGVPDNWTPMLAIGGITKVTDAHSGSSAVRGEVVSFYGSPVSAALIAGSGAAGTSCNVRAGSLTGYYKLVPAGSSSDILSVDIIMFKGSAWTTGAIGAGGEEFGPASSYTKFTVPISYIYDGTPDSCYILIVIDPGENADDPTIGSYFILDDLAFGDATGIADNGGNKPLKFQLDQNYPNPFNPTTKINYQLPKNGMVTLKVYDILGSEVKTLVNEIKQPGAYEVNFDGSSLPSGVYFYRLTAGTLTQTKKLVLMK
jgi:Secretion system C-terminal sorting domain